MLKWLLSISILLLSQAVFAPNSEAELKTNPQIWVDAKYNALTWDERIAQLMMIEVRPTYGKQHLDQVRALIKTHQVGGVIFFKGDPLTQVKLTNEFQGMSSIPLMVAIDGEWGLAMRLKNTTHFPYQMALGGIQDNHLIYEMGQQIGRQCKRMGIHVNFAPVIDVNNNINNPVINYRSFGEDITHVAQKGWAYARGMQEENVIACAKHFPGHGDTDVDSHKDLPVIKHSRERLDSIELFPFRSLIDSGVMSIMTAHLYIPAIDNTPNQAISISPKAINGLLRNEMGFDGLAFTDALNMQGVAKFHAPGVLELKALEAGNDVLLAPGNIAKATALIKQSMAIGSLSEAYVEEKVKKILAKKYWLGLHDFKPIAEDNLLEEVNSDYAQFLLSKLVEKQLSVVANKKGILPLEVNSKKKVALVSLGELGKNEFIDAVQHYQLTQNFRLSLNSSSTQLAALKTKLAAYDLVLISLHNTSKYPKNNYGVPFQISKFIKQVEAQNPTVLIDFGNPYNLKTMSNLETIVLAYEDKKINRIKAAQLLFGAIPADAFLPVSISSALPVLSRHVIQDKNILEYALPAEVGVQDSFLFKIDSLALDAIAKGATPGCQILIAKHGQVFYQKSFGKHTYGGKKVKDDDVYDLASLTKILATTLSVMKLYEDSLIDLDDPLSKYVPFLDTTNKKDITVRQVLTHTAGLKSWIPFYRATIADPITYDSCFSPLKSETHSVKVGDYLYMREEVQDYIFNTIFESEIKDPGKYRYSDLGMILMRVMIENVTGTSFEQYLDSTFYSPMGLRWMTFNPWKSINRNQIIPTEESPDFRKFQVKGYVHDPAAIMLGGISGHAGLFANSMDVAAIMQMLLNGGFYNGHQFFEPETIEYFTSYHNPTKIRRGLGFDKPEPNKNKISPCSELASPKCFGHSGFTGTQTWADPKTGMVYVFLSNRVYPTAENKKLISMSVRSNIMDVIYQSMEE
jgi:beta-N-acetylhexosaminidase